MVGQHLGPHARIGAQGFDTGAAGQKEQIEETPGFDLGEGEVGVGGDAAASGDVAMIGQRRGHDLNPGPAEEVDRREGFDFFKAVGERNENGGHGRKGKEEAGSDKGQEGRRASRAARARLHRGL